MLSGLAGVWLEERIRSRVAATVPRRLQPLNSRNVGRPSRRVRHRWRRVCVQSAEQPEFVYGVGECFDQTPVLAIELISKWPPSPGVTPASSLGRMARCWRTWAALKHASVRRWSRDSRGSFR